MPTCNNLFISVCPFFCTMTNDKNSDIVSNATIPNVRGKRGKFQPVSKASSSLIVTKVSRDQVETGSSHSQAKAAKARSAPKSVKNPLVLDASSEHLLKTHHYEIQQLLGTGAFSEVCSDNYLFITNHNIWQVFCAANSKHPDRNLAVKIINLSAMKEKYLNKFLPRELQSLASVRHEYVIKIYDIFRVRNRIFIFMERATKGDLSGYLRKLRQPMEEPKACKWFYQMCTALAHMHDHLHIAHRDLKIGKFSNVIY